VVKTSAKTPKPLKTQPLNPRPQPSKPVPKRDETIRQLTTGYDSVRQVRAYLRLLLSVYERIQDGELRLEEQVFDWNLQTKYRARCSDML